MTRANVDSIEVLKAFRASLWKFSEAASAAMADAESQIHRTLVWLETEQLGRWETEIRKRHDWLESCKQKYREKVLYKDSLGNRPSGFDERKAMDKAARALEEAEQKHASVKKAIRLLQKEVHNYSGSVQHFATDLLIGIPNAVAKLDKMTEQLRTYVTMAAPETVTSTAAGSEAAPGPVAVAEPSMARQGGDAAGDVAVVDVAVGKSEPGAAEAVRTPPAEWRSAADEAPGAYQLATSKPLSGPQRLAIASLNVKHRPPEPQQTVTIAEDLRDPGHIFLHHAESAGEGDTGWFIGPADPGVPIDVLRKVKVGQLLQVRPDFREIMALPRHYVLTIRDGLIAGIKNEKGQEIWDRK